MSAGVLHEWPDLHGSILDTRFLATRGQFDIVYAWGVLHHTGQMWGAFSHVMDLVKPGGRLYVAIYNDQGAASSRWRLIKRLYNRGPFVVRQALLLAVGAYFIGRGVLGRITRPGHAMPLTSCGHRGKRGRGMSRWHDLVDWVGGYPFEVAKPEDVFDFCRARGFALRRLKTVGGGLANNEFVFIRTAA